MSAIAAHAICIVVAGTVRSALPDDSFTLAWTHSVQRTQWEERYRRAGNALVLEEARVQGSGAGMEAGEGAVFDHGWWRWNPQRRLESLTLAQSPYAGDYRVCTVHGCSALHDLAAGAAGEPVSVAPCPPA